MTQDEFERLLDRTVSQLTAKARKKLFAASKDFENRVRDVLEELGAEYAISIDYDPHPCVFPDIAIGEYGVEVKFTTNATWRSVANSVFETTRNRDVIHIYVVFGKMGGVPEVKWSRYADSVIHVRTSHVPRFEVEMDAGSSLFDKMGITYNEFSVLPTEKEDALYQAVCPQPLERGGTSLVAGREAGAGTLPADSGAVIYVTQPK